MSAAQQRPTNVATRDPIAGILTACAVAIFLFFTVAMPAAWIAGDKFFHPTSFSMLILYKAMFLHADTFITWLSTLTFTQQIDIIARITIAAALSIAAAWYIARDQIRPRKTEVIEAGETVEKDEKKTIQKTEKQLQKADGIYIHPKIRIPRSRESEHIFIGGSTGAGKSQTLSWMIDTILQRGDKSLIFDIKGDYSSQLISPDPQERRKTKRFLVAPWDTRSIQWNIAKDIQSDIDADAFAAAFIPLTGKESNPYFTQAAQDVLSGVLIYMIRRCGSTWGWQDLSTTLADPRKILSCLQSINHAAAQHIQLDESGSPSPQSQGVLGSIRAPLKSLDTIAGYWSEPAGIPIVSSFLKDEVKGITLVLAARPDMQEIATPLISGLLALMMRKGLALPDSKSRRVWFIMDELGALPKISKLVDLITLGRSKGLCLIAGTQDLGRLESVYGKEQVQTISSQFGTHLIGRLGDSSTAKWAAELFGQQRIERLQISENQQNAYTGGLAYQPAVSTTWQQSDKAALLDSDFLHLPKATGEGFYMYARLTDDNGAALLGKLKYPINPVPTPFPACIEVETDRDAETDTTTSGGGGATQQPEPQQEQEQEQEPEQEPEQEQREAMTEAQAVEELEALITQNTDPAPQEQAEQEQGEDGSEFIAEQAVEEAALHAVGLEEINSLLDVAEAMSDGSSQPTATTSTQSHSTKKKRKKRIRKSLSVTAVEI
ncbi:type IV secretion system DNA-binding domain-containing protein [Mariprofundus ferrooxydans]|uniref:type IV secretion system DNA-binding domain-containing protein n=1 Tax=Mariprofundus ferrooxydans TaxID=314344 RepID=UPI00037A026C|nr:type IV secretion system DNA-binding domain-containing protein [Mariprofundus ferrooxydans]